MKTGKSKIQDRFERLCRSAGLKVTPQRLVVYKALSESVDHPSADSVYRRVKNDMPNISFDTVNRTLLKLAEVGAAFIVEGSGDVKRFDGNMDSHQHFKCVKCKKIFDFHYKPFDDIELPAVIENKFKILRKTVYLEGLCSDCNAMRKHNLKK